MLRYFFCISLNALMLICLQYVNAYQLLFEFVIDIIGVKKVEIWLQICLLNSLRNHFRSSKHGALP